jgi:hypothetical protein
MRALKNRILLSFAARFAGCGRSLRKRTPVAARQFSEARFRHVKNGLNQLYKSLILYLIISMPNLLRSTKNVAMLKQLIARDGMRSCSNRADANRVDGLAGGRRRSRAVKCGALKQGGARQEGETPSLNRVSSSTDISQAQGALCR